MARHYLDHASTSPLRPESADAMAAWLVAGPWGDPGRIHAEGMAARAALEDARDQLAALVGARNREVVFTSGATEALVAAVHGAAGRGRHLVLSAVEHSAVRIAAEQLAAAGTHEISVVEFQQVARAAIADIEGRGRLPLVVGGSWLYVQAIVDQWDFPPTDPEVRSRWEEALQREGSAALHARLAETDPAAAAAIEVGNGRRIVRALEVIELTGTFTARLPDPVSWKPTLWLGIDRDRSDLDERIAHRAQDMWQAGLLDEVRGLRLQSMGATASKAVGYAQALGVLDGELSEAEALEGMIVATRRLARRQQRRFRSDGRIHWCATGIESADVEQMARMVAQVTST